MTLFLEVVTGITLPIVLMIGLGFALKTWAGLEVATLNRLVIYGTLPALLLTSLAGAELPAAEVEATLLFTLGQFFGLLALGWAVAVALRLDPALRPLVAMAAAFANSGNFGIPLIELSLGPAMVPHQAIVTALLTVLIPVLAPALLTSRGANLRQSLKAALKAALTSPLIPAMALGLGLNALDWELPRTIGFPLELVGSANTPVALIALGAHLGAGGWAASRAVVGLGVGLRLVLAPLATLGALLLFDLPGGLFDMFLIGAGAPVGILLPIFCAEYRGDVRAASAMVVISTALSPIAVTILITISRIL